ncbi:Methyl-accepting chemotaxis protein [Pseudomonas coronafaciens pv. garcae]|nr:Methyl-accepting chemotaxis protein [Pseudomonas coronafaciens pv. garcae]RMM84656.1 Methyl-accepting chemotaxis protein [Pseudomonas coronafaciens pv. striafaciens]RMV85844.1 Methyl-accepting chemotaxis protein [Pseudomonas coronafaciens pv. garcae]
MLIGYARVSTGDQLLDLQRDALEKAGCERVFEDTATQLASAPEKMTAVTEDGSRGLVRQNDEFNQAATAVTEMSAAVDEVARNAEATDNRPASP